MIIEPSHATCWCMSQFSSRFFFFFFQKPGVAISAYNCQYFLVPFLYHAFLNLMDVGTIEVATAVWLV